MDLPEGKKIYFASDFHLGIPNKEQSQEREKRICRWLDEIRHDAVCIYLVGDIFDAWFEYKHVVPKGFIRFLGKLAELRDAGVPIEVFTGNHDLWMHGYFQEEMDIPVHHHPVVREYNNKRMFIGHGDGLGPGDHGYKALKKILTNPMAQWMYRRIHPDTGVGIASWLSRRGPKHMEDSQVNQFMGPDREWLVQFALETLKTEHFDYFIFGHRHIALTYQLNEHSVYINLGDWLVHNSYAVFDGEQLRLEFYKR